MKADDTRSLVSDPRRLAWVACKMVTAQAVDHHTCEKCGGYQNIHHQTNRDGSHSHKCPRCGNVWWHGGPLGYPTRYRTP